MSSAQSTTSDSSSTSSATQQIFPHISADDTTSSTHRESPTLNASSNDTEQQKASSHPYFTFPPISPFHLSPHTIVSSLRSASTSSTMTPPSRRVSSSKHFGDEMDDVDYASEPGTPQRSLLQKNYVSAPVCTQIFLALLYYSSRERCQEEIGRYMRWWTAEDLWWGESVEKEEKQEAIEGGEPDSTEEGESTNAPELRVEPEPEKEEEEEESTTSQLAAEDTTPLTTTTDNAQQEESQEEPSSASTTTSSTAPPPLQIKTSASEDTRKRKRSELLIPKPSPPRKLLRTSSSLSPLHHIQHRAPQAIQLSHFQDSYKQYLDYLIKDESIFNIFISFWIDSLVHLKEEFVKVAHDAFHTNVLQENFHNELGIARHNLNQWIEKETRGKIYGVFEERDLTPGTQSVLFSAITFHGQFKYEFPRVTMGSFHTLQHGFEENTVHCEMMERVKCREIYGESPTFTWISLPYSDERYHLLILLPREGYQLAEHYDLPSIIHQATSPNFTKTNMSRVRIPKFEVRSQFNVAQHFKRGGIMSVFNRDVSNLQQISEDHLTLNHVIQEVFFNTIELGTHPSVTVSGGGNSGGWKDFDASRAFAFAVYDSSTESVLFDGALYDPTVTEKVVFE